MLIQLPPHERGVRAYGEPINQLTITYFYLNSIISWIDQSTLKVSFNFVSCFYQCGQRPFNVFI